MSGRNSQVSVGAAATVGLGSLAAAVGIGRFAFTPLLPLMQEAHGLTLTQGAWLATANYTGYFVGAFSSFLWNPNAGTSARLGLVFVAVSTLFVGLTGTFYVWLALRFAAGIGSAFVLVGASMWAMAHLAVHRRPEAAGLVFAGVGIGMTVAGLVALACGALRLNPDSAWMTLGALCALVALAAWRPLSLSAAVPDVQGSQAASQGRIPGGSSWRATAPSALDTSSLPRSFRPPHAHSSTIRRSSAGLGRSSVSPRPYQPPRLRRCSEVCRLDGWRPGALR